MLIRNREKWIERQIEMSKYIGKRKHVSQMKESESYTIWKRLKGVKKWEFSEHALDRLKEKGIKATYDDIISMIGNAELIEYKIDYNRSINRCDERVVLRSKSIINKRYNIHVVYNLSRESIVTVWMNHVRDRHHTLDWSIYDENLKVFDELKE